MQSGGKVVNSIERSENVKYRVVVGVTETYSFVFERRDDALDFVAICLDNGYRATVIPVKQKTPASEEE